MALSHDTRRALRAYDSFTDFARCPDLPWAPEVYEQLDDQVALSMLGAFCYAWAASQQAAGVYSGSVINLANKLLDALPSWEESFSHQRKVEWTLSLGVKSVLLQLDSRPPLPPAYEQPGRSGVSGADRDAVDDMATFFQITPKQATLLFQLGRALGKSEPVRQAEVGGQRV